jgi:formylglycine-generating enzyme required for sulfatase activity
MGSPATEAGRFEDEGPQHSVTIAQPFAITRFPITRREYEQFVRDTHRQDTAGCMNMSNAGEWVRVDSLSWRDPGFAQSSEHPVVCVSWDDAVAYAEWLSARSGHKYRLLSEAEFEYVARAGATTAFPWGDSAGVICAHANSFDVAARRAHPDWPGADCDDGYGITAPVDSFPANAFGVYGTSGNVFQWTADCFAEGGYVGAPSDGSARDTAGCVARVIRGGSWLNGWRGLRAAMRDRDRPQDPYTNIGIRLARIL